jgi:hypothetical protein
VKQEIEHREVNCTDLLGYVDLSYLTDGKRGEFLDKLNHDSIPEAVWAQISRLLRTRVSEPPEKPLLPSARLPFKPGANYFDGVFAHFKTKNGKNCATDGTIVATASNTHCGTLSVLFDVSDYGHSNYWHHDNVLGGYFQVDFKDRRLVLTHYAIHNSVYWVREHDFLKTWTVEESNCGKEWTIVDSRENDETLHGSSKVQALFTCNRAVRKAFRYVRLYQRGRSHDPRYYHFLISRFEVFGDLLT